MNVNGYTVEIVKDPKRLQSLQPDWDNLFQRADRPCLIQSFEWTWCVWETITKPSGGSLHCVVIRENNRLVLIWPLAILRFHRFWRAARPLSMRGDYTDVLVEDSRQARQLANLAWETLQKSNGMDLIRMDLVRTDSLLHQVLRTQKAPVTEADLTFYLAWEDFGDWTAYHGRLSSRRELDRRLRRLQECGRVDFELIEDSQGQHKRIAWLLQHKLEQLALQGAIPTWGKDSKQIENFLTDASLRVSRFGRLLIFALTLENAPIAVQTWIVDPSRMVLLHSAYEPKWSKYGPGNLLLRHSLHWAFKRRLLVEFGPGNQDYKKVFGNREVEVLTRIYATNSWGHLSLRLREWLRALQRRLNRLLKNKRAFWLGKTAIGSASHTPPVTIEQSRQP